ncbi:MAG: DUF6785 family protein, partial [Phycisphaerae bacterium]
QFLTMQTVNADIETATPVAWAVGLIFALVLVLAIFRGLSKVKSISRPQLVILFTMLTLAVPLMNLGLIRPFYLSSNAVLNEYLYYGTSTYRTAYNRLDDEWFPLVPRKAGFASARAKRYLNTLIDYQTTKKRDDALREVKEVVELERQRLADIEAGRPASISRPSEQTLEKIRSLVPDLGPDQASNLLSMQQDNAALKSLGLAEAVNRRYEVTSKRSREALQRLPEMLAPYNEKIATRHPATFENLNRSGQERFERDMARLTPEERQNLMERVEDFDEVRPTLVELTTSLSRTDFNSLRRKLTQRYLEQFQAMDDDTYQEMKGSFVYRLSRDERGQLIRSDGLRDALSPNENTAAMTESLWPEQKDKKAKQDNTFTENLGTVFERLPWSIWVGPILRWGLLFIGLFLLLMCLAEWLRRKWIERENLAFPLVEVADGMIRHDASIETAFDAQNPPKRKSAFNSMFIVGFVVGFVWLFFEGLGHYEFMAEVHTTSYFISKELFTEGAFKEMDQIFFVISPIVLGIAFLVSLEVSFSVWVIFLLYNGVVLFGKLGTEKIQNPYYTGWGGGRNYPFPMEQLLGAVLCFSLILLWKSFRSQSARSKTSPLGSYVPNKLMIAGFIVIPLLIAGLLLDFGFGISKFWLIGIGAIFIFAQTIAAARVRAETGLPTQHVSYEYTKLPIVLGITGLSGAPAYVRWISLAFLPMSLLFRSLPQQLENLELARRHKVNYGTIAIASVTAVLVAVGVGMVSWLVLSYYWGSPFIGAEVFSTGRGATDSFGLARYALWVSHFKGELGLGQFNRPHWIPITFMGIGFVVFGALSFLRGRFLRFPLHPLGYLLLLMSIYYSWISPYVKGGEFHSQELSLLWGSVFVAWVIKKLVIKYGGMNMYKKSKPLFIGLVVGAVFCIFAWNMTDLVCSMIAEGNTDVGPFIKHFTDRPPYSPRFY